MSHRMLASRACRRAAPSNSVQIVVQCFQWCHQLVIIKFHKFIESFCFDLVSNRRQNEVHDVGWWPAVERELKSVDKGEVVGWQQKIVGPRVTVIGDEESALHRLTLRRTIALMSFHLAIYSTNFSQPSKLSRLSRWRCWRSSRSPLLNANDLRWGFPRDSPVSSSRRWFSFSTKMRANFIQDKLSKLSPHLLITNGAGS